MCASPPNSPHLVRVVQSRETVLGWSLFESVPAIFGQPVLTGPGYYVLDCQGERSLGTIRPKSIHAVIYAPGDDADAWDYRIVFDDGLGQTYRLKITDLSWQYFCHSLRGESHDPKRIAAELTETLQERQVYLRIGLSRGWKKFPERCFLQVNGVYTFPDYLEGRTFADFTPRRSLMNSSYLYLNGLRFHYFRENRRRLADEPLVLHHGLASNARIWEMVAPRLAERGHPVYALDARGHGLSDKPEDGYDIETITDDLAAFIQTCQLERPVLVGHSWGGSIALNYAARFSIGPRAPAGIVLVDGGISQLDDAGVTWEEMEQRLTPPRLAGMPLSEFQPRLEAWFAEWGGSEQAVSITLGNFEISEDERIYPRLTFERHMRIVRSIWDFKTYDYFTRVRCPTLDDPCPPKGAAQPARTGVPASQRTRRCARPEDYPQTARGVDARHNPRHPVTATGRAGGSHRRFRRLPELSMPAVMSGYTLRPARAEDFIAIRKLIHQVGINPMGLHWERFILAVDARGADDRLRADKATQRWVTRAGLDRGDRGLAQSQGVASEIIRHLMEDETGRLFLTCRTRLGSFYQRFGFRQATPTELPPYFRRLSRLVGLFRTLHLMPSEGLLIMVYD